MEVENAIIESVMLGYEDHGIMTAMVYLKFGSSGQGFGGYALDRYDDGLKRRTATGSMGVFVAGVLGAVGCERWEKLVGKPCRIKRERPRGDITEIGNLIEEKWFCPKEAFKGID